MANSNVSIGEVAGAAKGVRSSYKESKFKESSVNKSARRSQLVVDS
jgi:hypothetical protein